MVKYYFDVQSVVNGKITRGVYGYVKHDPITGEVGIRNYVYAKSMQTARRQCYKILKHQAIGVQVFTGKYETRTVHGMAKVFFGENNKDKLYLWINANSSKVSLLAPSGNIRDPTAYDIIRMKERYGYDMSKVKLGVSRPKKH